MDFSDDDVWEAEVFKDPATGDFLRIYRNGSMCIGRVPLWELMQNPQVIDALKGIAEARGVPFKSWYEEFARDDHDPNSPG